MPLPDSNIAWPPAELAAVTPSLRQWSAWYSGDPSQLRHVYGREYPFAFDSPAFNAQRDARLGNGGVRGVLQRFWWGRPTNQLGVSPRDMIHVPIAGDLCQASADLLFADPPSITIEAGETDADGKKVNTPTQDRLVELVDEGTLATLAEAAEVGAALGDTYLRVAWDREIVPEGPFLTSVHADGAWPVFAWGRLVEVTFWTTVAVDGQTVWRHLENHAIENKVGVIRHGLYKGNAETLGQAVPLTERPELTMLADAVTDGNMISTESPGLAVIRIPHQRPQRKFRSDPLGVNLGRSVLDGIESMMDALDETYASWMRDIRLGKGRVIAAKSLLTDLGPGRGQTFDAEQEIYSSVNALAEAEGNKLPLEVVQFAIRYAEHAATADALKREILRTAGYSSQTFGEGSDAARVQTATEVESRERRSLLTRDRMIRYWKPGLTKAIEKLLTVDQVIFETKGVVAVAPTVTFPEGVQETQLSLAQTALALSQAESASKKTLVGMVHPDWDDDQVDAEVALIASEAPVLPDPNEIGNGFNDGPGAAGQ